MVTPGLSGYIKQARAAGQSDEQIKSALLQNGWAGDNINAAFVPNATARVDFVETPLVNPEDKLTNVRYAGFWIRLVASLIDGIILFIPSSLFGIFAVVFGGSALAVALSKLLAVIILGSIYIYIIYKYQASPGKMILGLTIVSDNLERITLGQVLLREIIGKFLSSLILDIGYIMVAFTQKKQGLHDIIAKTLVIYKEE